MDPRRSSLLDLLTVLFKHRASALAIVLSTMLGLLFWMFFIREDSYETEAKLLVRIGHEQSNGNTLSKSSVTITGDRTQDVNSESSILQSTDLLSAVITELNLDHPLPPRAAPAKLLPRVKFEIKQYIHAFKTWKDQLLVSAGLKQALTPREEAMAALRRALLVVPERNSNILTVHLFVEQREYAAPILNTLLGLYETFRLKVYQEHGTADFFKGEVHQTATSLHDAEEELRAFEDKWNISAIQKQKEVLLDQIAANQAIVNNESIEVRDLGAKLTRTERELKSDDPDIAAIGSFANDPFPEGLLQQLASLQAERQKLRMTELDTGARIRNNREQFRAALGMVNDHLKARLSDRQSSLDRRRQLLAGLEAEVRGLQDKEGEWNALKRGVKMNEDSYLDYQKRLEESSATSVMEQQNIGNISIVQHASDPVDSVAISKVRLIALAFLLSLIAAAAWIGVAEFLDDRIYTAADLQARTGAPVLEVIPFFKRHRRGSPKKTALDGYYRKAAWALASSVPSDRPWVVSVIGTRTGAGVTSAALGIARALSTFHDLRVLTVELDSKDPTYLSRFGLDRQKTIQAYASGTKLASEVIQKDSSGMWLAPSSETPSDAAPAFSRLKSFIEEAKPDFDIILLDTPPLSGTDGLALGAIAQSVILVAESGHTRYETLDSLKRELSTGQIAISGTLLNKQRNFVPGWVCRWLEV